MGWRARLPAQRNGPPDRPVVGARRREASFGAVPIRLPTSEVARLDVGARTRQDREQARRLRSSSLRDTEIIADLHVTGLDEAKDFYTDYFGLTAEEFNLGWVARYTCAQSGLTVQ